MSSKLPLKVSAGAFERAVLDRACKRLGMAPSRWEHDGLQIRGTREIGASIEIPGFPGRAVFNDAPAVDEKGQPVLDANGKQDREVKVHFEDWSPRSGYIKPESVAAIDALTRAYNAILDEDTRAMVAEAQEIARQNNQPTQVMEDEGVTVLEIQIGG